MSESTLVDFLSYLKVTVKQIEKNNLLMIEVKGFSNSFVYGVPGLKLERKDRDEKQDLLTFDFQVMPVEVMNREKHFDWDVKNVYNLEALGNKIQGIKVRAAHNADIALL